MLMTPVSQTFAIAAVAAAISGFAAANPPESPLDGCRAEPLRMAVVRDRGPKRIGSNVPEDVRLTPAEMKDVFEKRRAEWSALGYVETYPKDWKKCDFSVDGPKMRAAHPELFGLTPSGKRVVSLEGWPKWFEGLTKWCVSNDALVDAIVEKWRKAGRPYLLRFYENDGLLGFCRCEKCRALDADHFLDHKTDRYLSLFNRVTAKAMAERPDVTVLTFFYSNYRFPPRREKVAFPDNQVCVLIPSLIDDVPAQLDGWRKAGMKRFGTRPNYLCHYMPIPRGIEKRIYDELKMFREAGSIGAEWDASPGTAANAFDFYVAVRLAAHPDLSFEEVEDGWCERFGAAKETVRAYYRGIRARCDRSWKELIRYFNDNHLDFLDHKTDRYLGNVSTLREKWNLLSEADKAALHAMRVKNKLRLGDGTRKWYKVAEALLWDDSPRNRVYYNDFAIPRLADAYERAHAK